MKYKHLILLIFVSLLLAACTVITSPTDRDEHDEHGEHSDEDEHDHAHTNEGGVLTLPELEAIPLDGRKLRVVATTNIIGDVVNHIGGGAIELTVLLSEGQDPHGYEATPSDLIAMEETDIIFINGWDLEEQLAETVEENYPDKFVEISAGIDPISTNEAGSADPHVWFSIHNVEQWAKNVEETLHHLDPANEAQFEANLDSYLGDLESLEEEVEMLLAELPEDQRRLVTNHDSFSYLAAEYRFEIVGTVIPAASTSAEPSAKDMASLIEVMAQEEVCTIFAETTQNSQLAETVAAELNNCDSVEVISLYTGSLGIGEAETYTGMFLQNISLIVDNLK